MRIAYFTDTYLPQINGVTNTLEKLGKYLSESYIEHKFFAPDYSDDYELKLPSPISKFKSIKCPIYPECRLSIPFYQNLRKSVDQFAPDIIHLVTPFGIGMAGLRYAREREIPIVTSFHTNFDVYLRYYRLEYLDDIIWNFFRWFHSFSSINFCPSLVTMQTLKNRDIENLRIWSRGVDTDKFNPIYKDRNILQRYNLHNKITFLYVGRLAPEKDIDILTESIKSINSIYPGKAQFVLVGDGPSSKYLKETVPENVIFTGYLKGSQLAGMYASADVFVFPSSSETLGNVVLEAMASGLPVVAVKSGGVIDNVINNYNGVMCKPRDVESFTSGMEAFIKDTTLISSMGANARKYSLTKTWNKVFDQLSSDYYSVLETSIAKLNKTA